MSTGGRGSCFNLSSFNLSSFNLFGYQAEAVSRFTSSAWQSSFGLFFEPGLGKTRTLLEVAKAQMAASACPGLFTMLVVVPKPLIETWVREVDRWWLCSGESFEFAPAVYAGRKAWGGVLRPNGVTILNYDVWSGGGFKLVLPREREGQVLDLLVLDEATKIKNVGARRTRGLLKLSRDARVRRRAVLTGTPFASSPLALQTLLRFLYPDVSASYVPDVVKPYLAMTREAFRSHFAVLCVANASPYVRSPMAVVSRRAYEAIARMTYEQAWGVFKVSADDYLHVRRCASRGVYAPYKHLEEVPPLLAAVGAYRRAADSGAVTVLRYASAEGLKFPSEPVPASAMEELMMMRRACSSHEAKVALWWEDVEAVLEDEASSIVVVVFFRDTAALLKSFLDGKGVSSILFTGETKQVEREAGLKAFAALKVRVLIASFGVVSYGLNLQTADVMMFYDSVWGYEDYVQCRRRIDRVGQKRQPRYFHYIVEGTVEEGIYRASIEGKKSLNESVEELIDKYSTRNRALGWKNLS